MKKMINTVHLEGRIYQHDLVIKTVQNQASKNFGKEFISGNLEIAVDEDGLNVIPVHFTYVTETTNSGAKSTQYSALSKIINENKTWVTVGKDQAQKIIVTTAIALNDFYNQQDELISTKVNEGGFITFVNELKRENERNKFDTDMVITGVERVEKDPEKNIDEEYVRVKGAIFNFRNELLPVEYTIKNPDGMKYFENLGVTNAEPIFTHVWGVINCNTKTITTTEESAFGEPAVKTYERKVKEWLITGSPKVPYDFGDEKVLTAEELKKAAQDREVKLAEIKKRSDEYKAQKAAGNIAPTKATTTTTVAEGTFDF